MDRSFASLGARQYENMSNAEKASLAAYLNNQLNRNGEWMSLVNRTVSEVIARRAKQGETLDASAVLEEVIPLVKPHVDADTREGLFRRIAMSLP